MPNRSRPLGVVVGRGWAALEAWWVHAWGTRRRAQGVHAMIDRLIFRGHTNPAARRLLIQKIYEL